MLIVAADAALRASLGSLLTDAGWTVDTVDDGEQGVIAALAHPPDGVVSELWMPGLSGLQLCQLLRADVTTADVPVVLVGTAADRRSRFWGQRAGAHAFVDTGDLDAVVRVLAGISPRAYDGAPAEPALRPSSIPGRLSVLLDRALFDAVVAGELRALAFAGAEVTALFHGLTRLLADLLEYQWLALDLRETHRRRVYIHQHSTVVGLADGVSTALALAPETLQPFLVADGLPSTDDVHGVPVMNVVSLSDRTLGTLWVAPARRALHPDEQTILALTARELALPLHAVALLEESQRLAATDALTGLANRRHAAEVLTRELARCSRYSHPLMIALIDVDFFKRVNDSHGHVVGDRALCHVADVLRSALRETDLIARWGGEEFLVLLPNTSKAGSRVAAERLRAAVARSPLSLGEGKTLPLSVSIGLAGCNGQGLDGLLDEADRALYRAKDLGRNRVEAADGDA